MGCQGTLERVPDAMRPARLDTILLCQSRSLFIRTMTVGPGITPGLLTLRVISRGCRPSSARGLDALRVITAGGELRPALRTLPTHFVAGAGFLSQILGSCIDTFVQ